MIHKETRRDQFGSQVGFILACIGSAVGMGNIWLFPFRVGQFGGAAFLIPYIVFVIVIGYTGIVEEMCLGRAMRTGPHGAFLKATQMRGNNSGAAIGWIPVIGSLGIAIGYTVVVGWIIRFTVGAFSGSMLAAENSSAYFGAIAVAQYRNYRLLYNYGSRYFIRYRKSQQGDDACIFRLVYYSCHSCCDITESS